MAGGIRRNSGEAETEGIRSVLLSMRDEDLRVRAELAASGTLWDTYHPRMEEVHIRNATHLADILDHYGWPDASRFREDGQEAAWMILMHSISVPDLMRRGRALLAEAVKEAAAPPALLARLEDRIRTLEGLPQLYGTILDWDDEGRLSPLSIEAPEAVDERRASVGMTPLAEHVDRCRREATTADSRPPADPRAKATNYQNWLRRTGWR
ncbi:MAG: hypothetical protein M8861_03365 [marine benthic group bacterium]|nr:hypothetical protein [Gemmatimonadota bacterium]